MVPDQGQRICSVCGGVFGDDVDFCPKDGARLSRPVTGDDYIGQLVAGKYRVTELIGSGGMSEVYRAFHQFLSKDVAIKVLRSALLDHDEAKERFVREAKASAMIDHPNVVKVFDFGVLEDGALFMVMELLEGGTLAQAINEGALDMVQSISIMLQACQGIRAAHDHGIVHRDIKPENLFLAALEDGRQTVKLLDLGIAKLHETSGETALTKAGAVFGTPECMSPEQAMGEVLDHRSDIYSLGVVMYELFTGRLPYVADTFVGVLTKHVVGTPVPPRKYASHLTTAIEHIILKAMARERDDRYQTISELMGDLFRTRDELTTEPSQAPPKVPPIPKSRTETWPRVAPNDDATPDPRGDAMGTKLDIPSTPVDFDKPHEIAPGIFWVSGRDGVMLERNSYLRVFQGNGRQLNLLTDPGPPSDLDTVSGKVSDVIGSIKKVNLVFLNHQDPDVAYNAGFIQKMNPMSYVVASEDTWRLVSFYGLNKERYKATESFKNNTGVLATGHKISFIPTPYCHFRGAVMLYDHESRVLFSGDFFGGLSNTKALYADDASWEGVQTFHQLYMPSNKALQYAVNRIRELDPPPLIIAPQHGGVITGDLLELFMERMAKLQVGLDLFISQHKQDNFVTAINEMLVEVTDVIGANALGSALGYFGDDGSFPNVMTVGGGNLVTNIKIEPTIALENLVSQILRITPPAKRDSVELRMVKALSMWNIDVPQALQADDEVADLDMFQM